jgi:hypothetical protein
MPTRNHVSVLLEIYVGPDCFGSEIARGMARDLANLAIPGVVVRLLDLSDPLVERPPSVFASPTYLVNQQLVSLGNPDPGWLRCYLEDLSLR